MSQDQLKIVERHTGKVIKKINDWDSYDRWRSFVGPSVARLYELRYSINGRIIKEGLAHGDLEDILIPKVSVDEYVAKDGGDNVVLAFYVANVPEAVEPLRRFCDRCPGVIDTDSGDADTLKNTSIVYIEMSRIDINVEYVCRIIEVVCKTANLDIEDMSVSFPNAKKMYPYSKKVIEAYFSKVTSKKEK